MRRLDRYILAHLLRAFGFFALVFTGVVWLTQAVRLVDTVISTGQSAGVFLAFSALVLPQVLMVVLPLAGLAAALYTINKLYVDAELIVMMAAGSGPWTLMRPTLVFGMALLAAMAAVTMLLVPLGGAALAERTHQIRTDLANALIVERQFLHPMPGLTLFIGDARRDGEMAGVFLHDEREPGRPVTYTAERALLVRQGAEARLVMADGMALTRTAGAQLQSVTFAQFTFDLSDLIAAEGARTPRPAEYPIGRLLAPDAAMLEGSPFGRGAYVAEGHWKLVLPLVALLYPMVALLTLLAGPYRRGGFGKRVVVAIAVAVVIYAITLVARSRVQAEAAPWPVIYAGVAVASLYLAVLMRHLTRGRATGRAGGEAPA